MLVKDRPGKRFGRLLEPLLWAVFVLCVGGVGATEFSARAAARAGEQVAQCSRAHPLRDFSDDPSPATAGHAAGGVMGRLQIQRIGLVVPIVSDIDTASLMRGVGHVPGTATAGGLGTMALAAHRDTFFRPLRRIAKGMEIRVTDGGGTYRYLVDSTEIVSPEQVEVLAIRDRPELALVTCYPFNYIGAAPQRFIVHAHLVSLSPE